MPRDGPEPPGALDEVARDGGVAHEQPVGIGEGFRKARPAGGAVGAEALDLEAGVAEHPDALISNRLRDHDLRHGHGSFGRRAQPQRMPSMSPARSLAGQSGSSTSVSRRISPPAWRATMARAQLASSRAA